MAESEDPKHVDESDVDGLAGHAPNTLGRVSFDDLSPTEFENFAFDLFVELGYLNVDWRKGTPKDASPSDSGRDIEAYWPRHDADGHVHHEKWFADCKKYATGIPASELTNLMSWGMSEGARVGLIVASGYLSNGAKDAIARHNDLHGQVFRLRYWEYPQLYRFLSHHQGLIPQHRIIVHPNRTRLEVAKMHGELLAREFYNEMADFDETSLDADGRPILTPSVQMRLSEIEDRFRGDAQKLDPWGHDDRQYYRGAREALGWALGEQWAALEHPDRPEPESE